MTTTPPPPSTTAVALAELVVADSQFLGFCLELPPTNTEASARAFQSTLQTLHPDAAHVPVIWQISGDGDIDVGYDEGGEPEGSVGPGVSKIFQQAPHRSNNTRVVVGIVRYFGHRLLGVTCGRLTQCYQSIARLTLHRFVHGTTEDEEPLITEMGLSPSDDNEISYNIYGMGAGDCELILGVVQEEASTIVPQLLSELQFDGFRGAAGEKLPRLQNLQADVTTGVIPVYRYPGNYSGTEWETFAWSPTSLKIKQAVESALEPLVSQIMNHCVTNYYRDGTDFIAHHGDKDLDLNRDGVIVSVSLGADERILELRRRKAPHDVTRLRLPHGSMLVLGSKTNKEWTHSILPKARHDGEEGRKGDQSSGVRLSLTLRDVKTFQDLSSGKLFGQGILGQRTLDNVRRTALVENAACFVGLCALASAMGSKQTQQSSGKELSSKTSALVTGAFVVVAVGWRLISALWDTRRQERAARDFFSKTSSSGTKY